MQRGRKKKPALLVELHGNPGKRGSVADIEAPGLICDPPPWFDSEMRREWDATLSVMPPNLLRAADQWLVVQFVAACVEYIAAVKRVRELGQVIETKNGNLIQNPHLSIMNRQGERMQSLGAEMGFSPTSRASLAARAVEFVNGKQSGPRVIGNDLDAYLAEKPDNLN